MNEKNILIKIINNEIPSYKVYEDMNYLAILDINPKQNGHTILIPKEISENILMNSVKVKQTIIETAEKVIENLNNLNATGYKFVFNSGKDAGQEILHTHMHIIPYYEEGKVLENVDSVYKKITA